MDEYISKMLKEATRVIFMGSDIVEIQKNLESYQTYGLPIDLEEVFEAYLLTPGNRTKAALIMVHYYELLAQHPEITQRVYQNCLKDDSEEVRTIAHVRYQEFYNCPNQVMNDN